MKFEKEIVNQRQIAKVKKKEKKKKRNGIKRIKTAKIHMKRKRKFGLGHLEIFKTFLKQQK